MIEYAELYKIDKEWYLYNNKDHEKCLFIGDLYYLEVLEYFSKEGWELVTIHNIYSTPYFIIKRITH